MGTGGDSCELRTSLAASLAGFTATANPRTVSKKVYKASRTLRARWEVLVQLHDADSWSDYVD